MARSLAEWLDWQSRVHPLAMDFTLERIATLLANLPIRRPSGPVFVVGGTNGKGSVAALLSALMAADGRRVGCYTSPHLVRYQERMLIDGREIDDGALIDAFERIEAARGATTLTFFEYATAGAVLAFSDARLDSWVLEVGLGGRLDAVNAVDGDCAIVVSVGLDHTELLGRDVESIAREKAGIFRAGRPAILGQRFLPRAIAEVAARLPCPLEQLGRDFEVEVSGQRFSWRHGAQALADLPAPALPGAVQFDNAATALAALAATHVLPTRAAVIAGLDRVRLRGRFERLATPDGLEWVLDVAHNPPAAAALSANLAAMPGSARTIAVIGMLADKDAADVGSALVGALDGWVAVTLTGERGLTHEALAQRLASSLGAPLASAETVAQGLEVARTRAAAGDRIVVLGSFHTVGPALEWLRLYSGAPR
jgi:dihydrofolate synthase / folylpolyglutamate synthase